MSQQPQGPGWWQASDGRWYPPQPPPQFGPPGAPYPQYAQQRPSGPVLALEAERWSGWEAR